MKKSKYKIIFIFGIIFLLSAFYFLLSTISAATNIDSIYRYAWNDTVGWIDFGYSIGNVYVYSDRLEGYASSSVGFIALNCNSTPNGNICGTIDFKVSNDGNGYLTGWGYNDSIGWISFTCNHTNDGTSPPYNTNECITTNYGVTINSSSGDFSGWAWNDVVGWISFNCNNSGIGNTCASGGGYDYKVKTNWNTVPISGNLTSSVFDSQASGGAAINSIMWQGSLNNGEVKFQIASAATPTGPWEYKGPGGTNSDTDTYNPGGPDLSAKINLMYHNNQRYFRYKIFLYSDSGKTQSPLVEDVLVNWSP